MNILKHTKLFLLSVVIGQSFLFAQIEPNKAINLGNKTMSIESVRITDSASACYQYLNPLPQGNDLRFVKAINSNEVIAAGANGTYLHSTDAGTTWVVRHFIGASRLLGTAGCFSSSTSGFVVGDNNTIARTTNGGLTWQNQTDNNTAYTATIKLNGIWQVDTMNAWAVGNGAYIIRTTNGGASWSQQSNTATGNLRTVRFVSPMNGYAAGVGTFLSTTDGGTNWTLLSDTGTYNAMDFTTATTGFAVGNYGTIKMTSNGGVNWIPLASGTTSMMNAIMFMDSNTGFIVGDNGLVMKTTNGGSSWVTKTTGISTTLYSVSFANSGIGYAVGKGGIILRSTNYGENWAMLSTGSTKDIYGISFGSSIVGYTVGDSGTIFKTVNAGINWVQQTSPTFQKLYAVDFYDASYGTAVGASGVIITTSNGGTNWTLRTSGVSNNLKSVMHVSLDTIVCVGTTGKILYSSNRGVSWVTKTSGTSYDLNSVHFASKWIGTAVGNSGVILRTTNSGNSWSAQTSGTTANLYGVHMYNPSYAAAVTQAGTSYTLRTTNGGSTWSQMTGFSTAAARGIICVDTSTYITVLDDGGIVRAMNGGSVYISEKSPASNALYAFEVVALSSGFIAYAAGQSGTLIATIYSPVSVKYWNASLSTSWDNSSNWSPPGAPSIQDSVIIATSMYAPVMASTLQQVMIGSLFIQSGGNLTLNSGVNRFVIASDVQVNGTLALVANAATEIVVGGSWTILGGTKSDQGFTPANSTVTYQGRGSASGKYYNVTFELNSDMSSSGNVTVDNYCTVNDTFYLRSTDTLVINDSASDALSNSGMIPRGTIRRSILFGDTNPYAYETEDTYIKFNSGSSYPHYFTITTYPDTNPNTFGGNWEVIPSTVDTIHNIVTATALSATGTFAIGTAEKGTPKVKRASASGGDTKSALNYQFAMRYAQSEVPTGVYESDLRLLHLVPAPAQYTLSLTALLEGEYNEPSMVADTVTVEMHGATSPYPLVERASVPLNSSGVGTAYFDSVTDGAHYYIVVKPRNGIETWSGTPQTFSGGTMSYDFTTAASKAYGDNMKLVGTKWCIYTGDPNLDGFVDFSDLSMIDNDSYNYTSGYVVTDLNGDQFVDFTDLGLCDNNAYTYTSVYYPAKKLESAKKPGQKAITNAPGIPVKK